MSEEICLTGFLSGERKSIPWACHYDRKYQTVFGFTEEEAFKALEESALESKKADVKRWYDRFCFGECGSIYHPWSVTKFWLTTDIWMIWREMVFSLNQLKAFQSNSSVRSAHLLRWPYERVVAAGIQPIAKRFQMAEYVTVPWVIWTVTFQIEKQHLFCIFLLTDCF